MFTPFIRRFTDEKARDLRDTRALYEAVRERTLAHPLDQSDFVEKVCGEFEYRIPASLVPHFRDAVDRMLRLENVIFEFPYGALEPQSLSMKEQVDLNRFLRAKEHFLNNREKVLHLLWSGLSRIVEGLSRDLPEMDSPFSVPLVLTLNDPKGWIEGMYAVLGEDRYRDNGLFVEVYRRLYLNACKVSGIADPLNPTKPVLLPAANTAPVPEVLERYFEGTPLLDLFKVPVPLAITDEMRFSHTHIVGGSGAGKTQLLQHLILHDLRAEDPPALIIVDSQTDLIQKLMRADIPGLRERLLLITPRDPEHPPAINIFDQSKRLEGYDETTKEQISAGVIQTFDYLFTGLLGADLSAKQGVFFKFVARLMLSLPETMGRNATILDLLRLMEDPEPYKEAIARLPDIQREFFERDFLDPKKKTFNETKEQIRYRLNAILENPTLARLFTSPCTRVDLFEEINRGSVILVDTAKDFLKGASGQFGRIFISLVLQAILERGAIPERARRPAFLIVDEAASYFDSNIDDLLTEARKYRLGCVFAHQFLAQGSMTLRASLSANTAIKLASAVSMSDARILAADMRTTPDFIANQSPLSFAAYFRGLTQNAVSLPVQVGELERLPQRSSEDYAALMESNWEKVSLPRALPAPEEAPEPPAEEPAADAPASPAPSNPDKSTEW